MAYTSLIVTPICTGISANNASFTVDDGTGTYPEKEGGFGAGDNITPERPEISQVIICFMYRFMPFSDESLIRLPPTQPARPATFSNIQGATDRLVQVVELVLPNSYNWVELLDDGFGWDSLIALAEAEGALGQLAVWLNVNEVACVYGALFDLNNQFSNACSMSPWDKKSAMFIGTANLLATLGPLDPNAPSTEDLYDEGQAQIDQLVNLCNDPTCCQSC